MRSYNSLAALLVSSLALAQAPEFLFTVTKPEQTLSGSGGTVLAFCQPNEILYKSGLPCGQAVKWAPLTMFQGQAGDEDFDDNYWNPSLFGSIDALTVGLSHAGAINQREIYFSPATTMGNAISGAPGLRPGDVGRIRKIGGLDGQVETFLSAEQVQIALGLPPVPTFVNVDAVTCQHNFGVLFSLEDDGNALLCTGPALIQEGDVLMIPPSALVWSTNGTVAAVMPGGAVVAYTEAQMDAFVLNSQVGDRDGICLDQIIDTDAIEIDLLLPPLGAVASCTGMIPVPQLIFAGEALTGGAVLDTHKL